MESHPTPNVLQPEVGLRRRPGCLVLSGRILLGLVVALGLLAGAGVAYETTARAAELRGVTAPGELVDVGGHQLHIVCAGAVIAGQPTVILEAGVGGWSIHWDALQRELARETRVCAYDRAGYGWSEAGPSPRSGEQIVAELHTLLERAGERPPFLLVGASRGGQYARLYQAAHPEQVAGLVLVDAEPEELRARSAFAAQTMAQNQAVFSVLGGLTRLGVLRLLGGDPADAPAMPCLPFLVKTLPAEAHRAYLAVEGQPRCFDALLAEDAATDEREALLRAASDLGDLPVAVLVRSVQTGGSPEAMEAERVWQELQRELAGRSTNARLVQADASGHDIALDQPGLVLTAIRELLERSEA